MLMERWHPVTGDLGLIRAPVATCVSSYSEWQAGIGCPHNARPVSASLAEALDLLPPLSMEYRRKLFVPTAATDWTAFFQSGIAGSDPTPVMSVLSSRLGTLAMRVCSSLVSSSEPAFIWEVFAPPHLGGEPPLGYRRSIAAVKDGSRWVFEQFGTPYPFEQPEHYTKPRKRDRFTRDLLLQYVSHFGLAPLSDSFYVPSTSNPAIVLESTARWDRIPSEFTLDEVIAGNPWRRTQ